MRDESQVRERIERLLRENETLRQQGAKQLLSEDWPAARETMGRIECAPLRTEGRNDE